MEIKRYYYLFSWGFFIQHGNKWRGFLHKTEGKYFHIWMKFLPTYVRSRLKSINFGGKSRSFFLAVQHFIKMTSICFDMILKIYSEAYRSQYVTQ